MCTHMRYVLNKHIHKSVLVPCGHCAECRQRKADARAFRIRNSIGVGEMAVFVTLTYKNDYLPVVRRTDIQLGDVPVYRRRSPFKPGKFLHVGDVHLSSLPEGFDARRLRGINKYGDNKFVSVPFYKDLQDFFKRLRINLERNETPIKFKYYACNELGPSTIRSHAHLVVIIKREYFSLLRDYIVKSWPFADKDITFNYVQPARNVAGYVASYVNCDSSVPKIFQQTEFKPRHSYSKDFGISCPTFQLASILAMVKSGTLEYDTRSLAKSSSTSSLVPKYVINRYFPIFKGFSRLSPGTLYDFLLRPRFYYNQSTWNDEIRRIDYSKEDIDKIDVSLKNHYLKYRSLLYDSSLEQKYPTYYDYCADFCRVWKCYASSMLRVFYIHCEENVSEYPWSANYDNCNEITVRPYRIKPTGPLQFDLVPKCSPVFFPMKDLLSCADYNLNPIRVRKNLEMTSRYYALTKRRKVANYCMSNCGHNV